MPNIRGTFNEKRQFWLYLEGWLSVGLNVLLFIVKYWIGMATGSVAIMADAWHTLSDSLSSVVVLVGARFSAKSPDEEHPFGHGRAEGIAQFSIRMGRKYKSKSLIADGWHHRSDAIASAMIVAGIYAGRYFWWVDGALGIIVAVLIFYATFDILKQSINPLIGEKPDEETTWSLLLLTNRIVGNDCDIHHVHIHRYGSVQK